MNPDQDQPWMAYFPFGGKEYDQCKSFVRANADKRMISKTASKIPKHAAAVGALQLIIVAHGADPSYAKGHGTIYSEEGCLITSNKAVNTLVTSLRSAIEGSDRTMNGTISSAFVWVCYASANGVGATLAEALKRDRIPVYAAIGEIAGLGPWMDNARHVGDDAFARM